MSEPAIYSEFWRLAMHIPWYTRAWLWCLPWHWTDSESCGLKLRTGMKLWRGVWYVLRVE